MSRKTRNAQSRATFCRHSAVLSLIAVLLRKLPIIQKNATPVESGEYFPPFGGKKWRRSVHVHARPGSAPIGGGKKGEFRDWTRVGLLLEPRYKLYEDTND